MTWRDSYRLGIPEIDGQHKQLCDKIDELFAACSRGNGTAEVMKTLEFLESYTKRHFADEEKLQQRIGYPNYRQHKAMHDGFIARIAKMKSDMLASGATVAMVIQMNHVISDWLINHILKVDTELRSYIK